MAAARLSTAGKLFGLPLRAAVYSPSYDEFTEDLNPEQV